MTWTEAFAVLIVSHLAGDFILQTDWQARHKYGGLGRDPVARRALGWHVLSYTLAFVPALVWLWGEIGARTIAVAALVAIPHLLQDDGRALMLWITRVKKATAQPGDLLFVSVDQSFHVVTLFATALVAAA